MNAISRILRAAGTAAIFAISILSTSVNAITTGLPGQALLVPFVLASSGNNGQVINTHINLICPSFGSGTSLTGPDMELDDTNSNGALDGLDGKTPSSSGFAYLWYFYDVNNNKLADGRGGICSSPTITGSDDTDVLDWGKIIGEDPAAFALLNNVPGYLVIGTDAARLGDSAVDSLTGTAIMSFGPNGASSASIPVIPLSDGEDNPAAGFNAVFGNNVVYQSGFPARVSPIDNGMRLNDGGGTTNNSIRFDLLVGQRNKPVPLLGGDEVIYLDRPAGHDTLHVIWADRPIEQEAIGIDYNSHRGFQQSFTLPLRAGLNLLYFAPPDPRVPY